MITSINISTLSVIKVLMSVMFLLLSHLQIFRNDYIKVAVFLPLYFTSCPYTSMLPGANSFKKLSKIDSTLLVEASYSASKASGASMELRYKPASNWGPGIISWLVWEGALLLKGEDASLFTVKDFLTG